MGLFQKNPLYLGLLSAFAFGTLVLPVSHADIVLESLKESVPVRLQDPLSTAETPLETPVTVTLPDAIHWKELVIPAGTVLQASVIQNKEARRLGRPAHFKLAITEATLPQQEPKVFTEPLELTLGINPYETRRSLATRQIFISTVSNLATLPLDFVPGVSALAAYGIGSGLDVVIGAGQELQKDETFDKRSTGRRVAGVGLDRGGGVGADHGLETAGEAERVQQGHRQAGELVGADHQRRARAGQGVERLQAAGIGPGLIGDARGVDFEKAPEDLRPVTFVQGLADRREAALHQHPGAGADHPHDVFEQKARQAVLGQQGVERGNEVGGAVDQRPIEVEGDRRALHVWQVMHDARLSAKGWRHATH